jgi:UDP-sugar transporter A1/2/3
MAVGRYTKQLVLLTLVLHNSTTILVTRYTRSVPEQKQYRVACSVIFTEFCKLVISSAVLLVTEGTLSSCWADVNELAKTLIPAILFFVQNNVMYLALGNLDAATFQVTMQLRLITTAVMSVIILDKVVSPIQWGSLFLLAAGIAVVQVSSVNSTQVEGNRFVGFAAVVFNCCTSAFGAVYFEKLLKGSTVSLWTRNVQMATFSILVGVLDLLVNGSYIDIMDRGYFHGFTWLTFVVVGLQSAGGILLALVMKYADNILKGFAMAIAILVRDTASILAICIQRSNYN